MNHLYKDYIGRLSKRFTQKLDEIVATHPYELGTGFEMAICRLLKEVLPSQFGIARGYVVNSNSESAGDDIIIYDKIRFPTLNPTNQNEFADKEYIPIEAVCCYIEAKHTLHLEGEDNQSITHAIGQLKKVRDLISQRRPVPLNQLGPYSGLGVGLTATAVENFPTVRNPPFLILWARNVKAKKSSPNLEDPKEIYQKVLSLKIQKPMVADLMVIGKHNAIIPVILKDQEKKTWASPFLIPEKSIYSCMETPELAFGIGLALLMFALDHVQLGVMPWREIIADSLQIPLIREQ